MECDNVQNTCVISTVQIAEYGPLCQTNIPNPTKPNKEDTIII